LANDQAWEEFYSVIWKHAPRGLIEPEVIDVITNAHQDGHNVIALTAVESGCYGCIESTPCWRHEMLTGFGILFSALIPDTFFNALPIHRDSYPFFYKGIICCNSRPKGEVLQHLIHILERKPTHIVFVDDDIKNVHSVGHACTALGIPCSLYLYHNPAMRKPSLNLKDFMHKVAHVLQHGSYPNA
jgi:hypothetical protein